MLRSNNERYDPKPITFYYKRSRKIDISIRKGERLKLCRPVMGREDGEKILISAELSETRRRGRPKTRWKYTYCPIHVNLNKTVFYVSQENICLSANLYSHVYGILVYFGSLPTCPYVILLRYPFYYVCSYRSKAQN